MTALVSLLFINMIPTDYKTINFSLYLFVYFFLATTVILVNSQVPHKKNTQTLFSQVLHPLISKKVHMPVSFVLAYAYPITPYMSMNNSMKSTTSRHCGNTKDSFMTASAPTINESQ